MLIFHALGDWSVDQVSLEWTPNSQSLPPPVVEAIDSAWGAGRARLGDKLFDGPMCRLESFSAALGHLNLRLSRTSYRIFLGTNLMHPELADRFGSAVLANPVGVSPVLLTADGYLMMGRRNSSVAYYPNRVHPFAGALEPRDGLDVFQEVRRELNEELAFTGADIAAIHCTGIAEDRSIRQPELIFRVESTRTREQIESQLDAAEHEATWSILATREAVESTLARPEQLAQLTPIAVATLLLWGRLVFSEDWFTHASARLGAELSRQGA